MDYQLADQSIDLCARYMRVLGRPKAVAIGTIMTSPPPDPGRFNSLEEVERMCRWEPPTGRKRGAMLYTFSYDVRSRAGGQGTGQPDGAYTRLILDTLP